jgi:hypothetical protein
MSKVNKALTAKFFVETQNDIAKVSVGRAFSRNQTDTNVKQKHIEKLMELNTLRLLFLTDNVSEQEYLAKREVLINEADALMHLYC